MNYSAVREGVFLSRPNRFVAYVLLDGEPVLCHVKNTGRCRELLVPGAAVWVRPADNPDRRTAFDLVVVRKGGRLINIDSSAPNRAFGEYLAAGRLFAGPVRVRPETVFGGSRFDFYAEAGSTRAFLEVKGVTLEEDGAALFPDAPTLRGARHMRELVSALEAGFDAYAVFVIQTEGVRTFSPNRATDPAFADALCRAGDAGVHILALDCRVTPDSMELRSPVEVLL